MDKKIFTPRKLNGWQIVVEGSKNEAHIQATGNVPKDVKKYVEMREQSGLVNSFDSLVRLARLLTE